MAGLRLSALRLPRAYVEANPFRVVQQNSDAPHREIAGPRLSCSKFPAPGETASAGDQINPPPHEVRGRGHRRPLAAVLKAKNADGKRRLWRSMVEGPGLLSVSSYLPLPARFARHLPRARGRKLRLELHDLLLLLAQAVDAEPHHVAGLEKFRLRLHSEPDAGRCAGDDDVARLEHEELRAIPDQVGDAEDHGLGRALLPGFAVDGEPHVESLRIADLVLGDEPGPERAEGFAAFTLAPLAAAARDLKITLRNVVGEAIAGDCLHRLGLGEVARAAADDDAELDFVVELGGFLRRHGVVVRPADAARRLVEDNRLFRNRHAGFGGVVGIIQADGDEIADPADARAEPRRAAHQRQLFRLELAQLGKP